MSYGIPIVLPLAIFVAGYFCWNLVAFGTLTPVSGQVKQWWSYENLLHLGSLSTVEIIGAVASNLTTFGCELKTLLFHRIAAVLRAVASRGFQTELPRWPFDVVVSVAFLAAILHQRRRLSIVFQRAPLTALLLGAVLFFATVKTIYFGHWLPWYGASIQIIGAIVLGTLIDGLAQDVGDRIGGRLQLTPPVLRTAAISLLALNSLVVVVGRVQRASIITPGYQLAVTDWLREHTAPNDRIATWAAGSLGYFSERPVILMDGLVNSPAYFRDYLKVGREPEFLLDEDVKYVVGFVFVEEGEEEYKYRNTRSAGGDWRPLYRPIHYIDAAVADTGLIQRYEIWQRKDTL